MLTLNSLVEGRDFDTLKTNHHIITNAFSDPKVTNAELFRCIENNLMSFGSQQFNEYKSDETKINYIHISSSKKSPQELTNSHYMGFAADAIKQVNIKNTDKAIIVGKINLNPNIDNKTFETFLLSIQASLSLSEMTNVKNKIEELRPGLLATISPTAEVVNDEPVDMVAALKEWENKIAEKARAELAQVLLSQAINAWKNNPDLTSRVSNLISLIHCNPTDQELVVFLSQMNVEPNGRIMKDPNVLAALKERRPNFVYNEVNQKKLPSPTESPQSDSPRSDSSIESPRAYMGGDNFTASQSLVYQAITDWKTNGKLGQGGGGFDKNIEVLLGVINAQISPDEFSSFLQTVKLTNPTGSFLKNESVILAMREHQPEKANELYGAAAVDSPQEDEGTCTIS